MSMDKVYDHFFGDDVAPIEEGTAAAIDYFGGSAPGTPDNPLEITQADIDAYNAAHPGTVLTADTGLATLLNKGISLLGGSKTTGTLTTASGSSKVGLAKQGNQLVVRQAGLLDNDMVKYALLGGVAYLGYKYLIKGKK